MALDPKLRQIVSKQAGIYFIVTDKSQVAEIEEESKLRLYFINTEEGPVNCMYKFAQGDIAGFRSVYGKATRAKEKKGNFSHKVCEDGLSAGPIGVINIRSFDNDRDVTNIATINPNTVIASSVKVDKIPYVDLFDRNGFWSVKPSLITEKYYQTNGYLNFANVGSVNVSLFVVKAKDQEVALITSEYNKSLEATDLEIDDYPGLNWNTKVKDTFVDVYVFKNDFKEAINNPYYGYLFDGNGYISADKIDELSQIKESGFYKMYTGSVIPNLKSENEDPISIDTLIYNDYTSSGIICDINADLLEYELDVIDENNKNGYIDLFGFDAAENFDLLSYLDVDKSESEDVIPYAENRYDVINVVESTLTHFKAEKDGDDATSFIIQGSENIKIGDLIKCSDGYGVVESIEIYGNENIVNLTDEADNVSAIAYGNGKYFAFCDFEDGVQPWKIFSTNNGGDSWKLFDTGNEKFEFKKAYFGGGNLIALTKIENDFKVVYLNDNKMVVGGSIETEHEVLDIVFGNDIYLVICDDCYMYFTNPANNPTVIVYEQDAVTYDSVCFCNNYFYAVGSDGKLYRSNNARQWQEIVAMNADNNDAVISGIAYCAVYNNKIYIVDANTLYKMNLNGKFNPVTTESTIPTTATFMRIGNSNTIFTDETVTDAVASDILNNKVFAVKVDGKFFIKVLDNTYDWTNAETIKEIYDFDKTLYKYNVSRSVDFNGGDTYGFTSYADAQGTTEYGTGRVKKTGQESDGYTEVEVLSNSYDPSFVGQKFWVISTANANNTDIYQLYSDAGQTAVPLYVKISYGGYISKFIDPLTSANQKCRFFALESYKPVEEQFINGTAKRQKEILNMINDGSIVRGIKGARGARYLIDCFKSFVENNYKYQFGKLAKKLDENNKFVRCIINEPFIEDFDKSVNPLYKQMPGDLLDYSYIPEGGNKQYSTQLVDKFTEGADMCFFFGPGDRINNIIKPLSGIISNLFYNKSLAFDVVANSTGYLTGVTELEVNFDDEDRKYLEWFRYNPVIDFGGITVFGNLTGQKTKSKQQQIHNSELLAYIKENLYNMAKAEAFTKGTYDNYLKTQTETQNFMDSLALANAVKANPIVVCDATNNTDEVASYKIKLVHVEYEPIDCLEKVVFDLNIL